MESVRHSHHQIFSRPSEAAGSHDFLREGVLRHIEPAQRPAVPAVDASRIQPATLFIDSNYVEQVKPGPVVTGLSQGQSSALNAVNAFNQSAEKRTLGLICNAMGIDKSAFHRASHLDQDTLREILNNPFVAAKGSEFVKATQQIFEQAKAASDALREDMSAVNMFLTQVQTVLSQNMDIIRGKDLAILRKDIENVDRAISNWEFIFADKANALSQFIAGPDICDLAQMRQTLLAAKSLADKLGQRLGED